MWWQIFCTWENVCNLLLVAGCPEGCTGAAKRSSSAACHGHKEVCRMLLDAGCPAGCQDGWALEEAARNDHADVCDMLEAAGCPA